MKRMRHSLVRAVVLFAALAAAACGGNTSNNQQPQASNTTAPAANRGNVSANKADYPVFSNIDAGADSSVPAAQGGKGFTGEGWQTNSDFDLVGDPRAVKGGVYREYQLDFPSNLRLFGPEANTALNYMIGSMVYEGLLSVHPSTLEFFPALATHWQVAPDKLSYRYRINPNARWSDGQPVVADDVVATWTFMMDKGLEDPMTALVYAKFEKPVAESKYIVRVKSKELNWRNFLYFSASMAILPSHVLKTVPAANYIKEYNFKLLPGTGPYTIADADVDKGKSITIRRRMDYWAEKDRRNVGLNNFDQIREIVVRDQKLAMEMFKKGDLDFFPPTAKNWVEDLENLDRVKRGVIQRRKVYNENPMGTVGMAFNTRKAPYDDVRLREAMAHLLNRALMIEKLFYNEYVPMDSYYAGQVYANPANPKTNYDPQLALKLLGEAGWTQRDAQGRLTKGGQPLNIELLYGSKTYEAAYTTYQEDLRKVGISLNLRFVTPETLYQLVGDRKFDLVELAWGGLTFPNPETSYASSLADQNSTNNITGVKNKRIDELLPIYDKEFDAKKRIAIIREIDGILAKEHHYILLWAPPYRRLAFWNKFGMPQGSLTRMGDSSDIPSLWWYDPQQAAALTAAIRDNKTMPVGQTEVKYWEEYAKQHPVLGTDVGSTASK
jgi:microcin C transport system substrate-binding protein